MVMEIQSVEFLFDVAQDMLQFQNCFEKKKNSARINRVDQK